MLISGRDSGLAMARHFWPKPFQFWKLLTILLICLLIIMSVLMSLAGVDLYRWGFSWQAIGFPLSLRNSWVIHYLREEKYCHRPNITCGSSSAVKPWCGITYQLLLGVKDLFNVREGTRDGFLEILASFRPGTKCRTAGPESGSLWQMAPRELWGTKRKWCFLFSDMPSEIKERGEFNNERGERKVCRFKLEWLGNCSGISDESYGYKEGKPCIIIKLNRVLGFKPKASHALNPRI